MNNRAYNYDILPEMQKRYATRCFSGEKIPREELMPIFEAARYAPSCFNEQPWRFILGDGGDTYDKLALTLAEGNAWAKAAPVLILVLGVEKFKFNGTPNQYSRFDAGTASGFLQLEAVRRGFVVHCMAGFDVKKTRDLFNIPGDIDIIELIALGRPGNPEDLPEALRDKDMPGTRNPLESLFWK